MSKKLIKSLSFLLIISFGLITPVSICADDEIYLDGGNDGNQEILLSPEGDILLAPLTQTADLAETPLIETPQTPTQTVAAILPQPISTGAPALIVVHRVSNYLVVYDKYGQVVNSFVVSTGRQGHRTPLGTYRIYEHSTGNGYHLMVDGTYGKWCMRWKQGGYMFHSVCYARAGDAYPIAQEVADLGTSVSRGCIRLSVTDAEWLYRTTPNGCTVRILDD